MPIFAPVYRPTKHQQAYLALEQKRESKKRKRGDDGEDEATTPEQSPTAEASPRSGNYHPINKTDPYHVARHSREQPLPPYPFPHAAVRSPSPPRKTVDEELASLNPPLYLPKATPKHKSTSFKRGHLDNLTTILHRCMLKRDWQRASRAWALLLRTEISGRGIDVRQHGRWGIGAELLMRKHQIEPPAPSQHDSESENDASTAPSVGDKPTVEQIESSVSDDGFRLAREYYQRLILQYPHTPQSQHSVNALSIYPALFNVWVYEVQDRSKRARRKAIGGDRPSSSGTSESEDNVSTTSSQREQLLTIRRRELDEATPIAQRMDELLLSPPFDTSVPLLRLRGMVALWLCDLYSAVASTSEADEAGEMRISPDSAASAEANEPRQHARAERDLAAKLFRRVVAVGGEMPDSIMHHTETVGSASEQQLL